ncbi:hypothetical protein [Paracoccus methylarcula]|uniref:Uncharacterized protein n=1 Tax=Paracoccus methylarcula TaxID=72022 RepID=A0A422QWZ0_9RHOB|nr:hypothetical protein [Paracoccus methylarcula]RNF34461.1 hypothetical protein A7A09_011265 [Paracoccus methylarcula]
MKPIFIAGATLLAASSAFGFAKAVDYLAATPESTAPRHGNMTERNLPAISREQAVPASTDAYVASGSPQPGIPEMAPAERAAMIGKPERLAAMSVDETISMPQANYFMPFTRPDDPLTTPDTYSNMDSPDNMAQDRFHNLPMIGVYR